MGTEIDSTFFKPQDWAEYARRLERETAQLKAVAAAGAHSESSPVGGCF